MGWGEDHNQRAETLLFKANPTLLPESLKTLSSERASCNLSALPSDRFHNLKEPNTWKGSWAANRNTLIDHKTP